MGVVVCGELLGFAVCAVGVAILRLNWNRLAERLPMRRLTAGHLAILIALVFPMSVISGAFYQLSDTHLWQPFVQSHPELESFDAQNTMELIPKIAEQLPLPLLLVALALAPAIGEELVFRGVIGRGLTARWGLIGGVLLTSVLFAAIHIHPAHAVGVLPLGICMHLLYLATRNFLAPVLFHLLNNTVAVIAVDSTELPGGIGTAELPAWSVTAAAVLCAVLFFMLLWSTRTRFRFANGAEWSPGFATADSPSSFLNVQRVHDSGPPWLWGAGGLSLLAFFASAML
jgi:membrane protease YdiL (CAAX protease family)